MIELNQLMEDMATAVILQEEPVQQTEQKAQEVYKDTEQGVQHLNKAEKSAKRARKLKWWCFAIVVLILVIIGVVLGVYFGVVQKN